MTTSLIYSPHTKTLSRGRRLFSNGQRGQRSETQSASSHIGVSERPRTAAAGYRDAADVDLSATAGVHRWRTLARVITGPAAGRSLTDCSGGRGVCVTTAALIAVTPGRCDVVVAE